jgi:hypothetical protein
MGPWQALKILDKWQSLKYSARKDERKVIPQAGLF